MCFGRPKLRFALAAAMGLAAGACSEGLTGPFGDLLLVHDLSVDELGQQLNQPARVEITLAEHGTTARTVRVKSADERANEELLVSHVTAVSAEGDAASVTLDLGVEVTVNAETRFRGIHGDEMGFDDFVATLDAFLAEGIAPMAKLAREPRDVPQGPEETRFHATVVHLTDDPVDRMIRLDVDARHLERSDTPPPDAWLTVLGIAVELRVSDGTTELIADEDERDEAEFEGVVARVGHGEFELRDGTVVRVGDATRMAIGDRPIESLEPIGRAIEAGLTVTAWGEGVLAEADRHVINAIVVRFAIDDDDDDPDEIVFEGVVRAVDLEEGTVVVGEHVTVVVTDETRLKLGDEEIESLEPIARALEDDLRVVVRGEGHVRQRDPLVVVAEVARFAFEPGGHDGAVEDFEGAIAEVHLDDALLVLVDGTKVRLTEETEVRAETDFESLAGVAEALEAGLEVRAVGEGEVVENDEQRVLVALWVRFVLGA